MPKEDRRITFSNDEIYKAVYALAAQKQLPKPPPGALKSVEQDEDDQSKVIIHLENPQSRLEEDRKTTHEYSRDFLAAALMLFCRGQGIPLPKSARKSVMIRDEGVMLRVQI